MSKNSIIPIDRFLSDNICSHTVESVMKTYKIKDEKLANAILLSFKDEQNPNEIDEFKERISMEKQLIKNDLELLENKSEVFLNRE
jgi:hypothetical protein